MKRHKLDVIARSKATKQSNGVIASEAKQSTRCLFRLFLLLCISAIAGIVVMTGCGTAVTVVEEEYGVDAPPSDRTSAGVLSGFGYATAGEHYKTVHSLGRPVAEKVQTSANGIYQVK